MVKGVDHKWPTPRPKDTPLGKVMGYLSELLFWRDIDTKCRFIDTLWPFEVWPLDGVDDIFINIFRHEYEREYQSQYDTGADQGNKINDAIFGWLDDLKDKAYAEVDRVKEHILTNFVDPLRDKINTELEPTVNNLLEKVRTAEATIRDAENRINEALTDVANLKNTTASLNTQVNDVRATVDETVRDFKSKMDKFDIRLGQANNDLEKHTKNIQELFERIQKLEGQTREQTDLLSWLKGKVGG